MLTRNKIYERDEPSKDAKKIYIFCEGDTEVNYFNYFKGFSSNIDIVTIGNTNTQSDPKKLHQDALLKLFGNEFEKPELSFREDFGDEVWFVIDTDHWNKGNKIEDLRTNCLQHANWNVSQSNSCFELWLFYHFNEAKPLETEIEKYVSFKAFVNNKIKGGFNTRKNPILIQDAIANGEKNFEKLDNQPVYLSTEVFLLAKAILPFIKNNINQGLAKYKSNLA
ncbi:MAG: RloB domain-containing protein [Sphingobacteriales bacterium]|nr:MAG: RloB domain-containing protein [Sphingobacteriales bacterium]TAF78463.1 MAG: RloB domain-containing protein [Sphingobacteriales bacterium]